MAKKARPPAPVPKPHSAEIYFAGIAKLDPAERKKFFGLAAYHPDNWYVDDLLAKCQQMAELTAKVRHKLEEIHYLQKSLAHLDHLEKLGQLEKEILATLERVGEGWVQTLQRLARYTEGPNTRKQKAEKRKNLILQYRDAGLVDPKMILTALRRDAPELAQIKPKTVRNILAKL
jgi:hypothetical protein